MYQLYCNLPVKTVRDYFLRENLKHIMWCTKVMKHPACYAMVKVEVHTFFVVEQCQYLVVQALLCILIVLSMSVVQKK